MLRIDEPAAREASTKVSAVSTATHKKILIHSMNFYPEFIGVGKYSGELAFNLSKKGHQVEVVAAPPHYPGWSVRAPYPTWRFLRETIQGVSVLRCPLFTGNGGGLSRMLAPLSFAAFAAPAVFWRILRSRPDVVVCVEPTLFSAPAALLAGKLVGARTVLHIQDLEVDAAFEVGHLKGPRIRALANALEGALLRRFDLLVTISSQMRQALLRKGAPADRAIVLRNWVDLDAIRPLPPDAPNGYRDALGLAKDKFVVLYSGHMGRKQALDGVLDAARQCLDQPNLHFVIAGEGPVKAQLVEAYGQLPNVSFLPLQPLERLNELLNLANLHILPQTRAAADLVLPSKLGGMLASGRPVVATVDPETELGRLLRGAAVLTPPDDSAAIANAITSAATRDLSELVERGRVVAMQLSDKYILPRFEEALVGPMPSYEEASDPLADQLSAARFSS